MARRKDSDTPVRSLTKIAGGSSYAVVIPKKYIRELKWKDRQKLVIRKYRDHIVIRDWKPGDD